MSVFSRLPVPGQKRFALATSFLLLFGLVLVAHAASPTISPSSLNWSTILSGSSANKSVTVSNSGNRARNFTVSDTGPNADKFSATTGCGSRLPENGSCTVTVTYSPSGSAGNHTAELVIAIAPEEPQGLSATDGTREDEIEVDWSDVEDTSSYDIRYKLTTTSSWTQQSTTTSEYTITGLGSTGTYDVQVRATNGQGSSNWVATTGFPMRGCPETTHTWGAGNACSAALPFSIGGTYALDDATIPHTGTASVTCDGTTGAWESVSATGCVVQPSELPAFVASKGVHLDDIELTWGDPGSVDYYEFRYKAPGSTTWSEAFDTYDGSPVASGMRFAPPSPLDRSTSNVYEFQIRATNAGGVGPWTGTTPASQGWVQRTCQTETKTWGHLGACQVSPPTTTPTDTLSLGLTTVADKTDGDITATCSVVTGEWTYADEWCSIGLDPAYGSTLTATYGATALEYQIAIDWSEVPTMQYYTLQKRLKDSGDAWDDLIGPQTATDYTWDLPTDERIYEFRVCTQAELAHRAQCSNDPIAIGQVLPRIKAVLVDQQVARLSVGAGETFNMTQTWRNEGADPWSQADSGFVNNQPTDEWSLGKHDISADMARWDEEELLLELVAPTTPGFYTFSTILDILGVTHPEASDELEFEVLADPECGTISTSVSETWNQNLNVTMTIDNVTSAESAWFVVYSEAQGIDNATIYPAESLYGEDSRWDTTFYTGDHADYGTIYIDAWAKNGINNEQLCQQTTIVYQELPEPVVTLDAVVGSYTEAGTGNQGFVVNRNNGEYANMSVSLPQFEDLDVTYELIAPEGDVLVTQPNLRTNTPTPVRTTTVSGQTWEVMPVSHIRVSYHNPDAALQGKETLVPIGLTLGPMDMSVSLEALSSDPLDLLSSITQSGTYDTVQHGAWRSQLLYADTDEDVSSAQPADENGEALHPDENYLAAYKRRMRSRMTLEEPSHITLVDPISWLSEPIDMPIRAPTLVSATDGTREDDVEITWATPTAGMEVFYQVFRDGVEVSERLDNEVKSYLDIPPERGTIYSYSVKAMLDDGLMSEPNADNGHTPVCRQLRFGNGGLNAAMTEINGLFEIWECLTDWEITYGFDSDPVTTPLVLAGDGEYKTFTVAIPGDMEDGAHTLNLSAHSVHQDASGPGPDFDETRMQTIAFSLSREQIAVNNIAITYNGVTAPDSGTVADSVGRFGLEIQGTDAISPPIPQ